MNRTSLFRLAMAFAVLAALWIPVSGSQAAPAAPTARVRVVHAVPTAGPLDVLVDGATAFPSVTFKTVTRYEALEPGNHKIEVVPSGTTTAVISGTLPLAADQDWSVAVTITPTVPPSITSIAPVVLLDDNTLPAAGMVRARFVHLVPLAPNVDIYIKGEATPTFSNVAFAHASSYATIPAGTYDLEVRLAGAPSTSPPIFTATGITLANQGVYTAWAMGEVTSPTAVLSVDRAPVLTNKLYLPILFR